MIDSIVIRQEPVSQRQTARASQNTNLLDQRMHTLREFRNSFGRPPRVLHSSSFLHARFTSRHQYSADAGRCDVRRRACIVSTLTYRCQRRAPGDATSRIVPRDDKTRCVTNLFELLYLRLIEQREYIGRGSLRPFRFVRFGFPFLFVFVS